MLSSPPRRVCRLHECFDRLRGVGVDRRHEGCDLVVFEHARETVGADEEEISRGCLDRQRVDRDRRLGAESARDRGALGMAIRFLRCEDAALDELGHQ